MLTIEQAQTAVLTAVTPLPAASRPLLAALGCTLAAPVVAGLPLPPFDNSAMDGFAVVAQDTVAASPETPRRLRVIEDLPAGTVPQRLVQAGTAARIMTGAALPSGADAVVMVERSAPGPPGTVDVLVPVAPGENVRTKGEDVAIGQTALPAGVRLGPGEIALAAALGHTHLPCVRPPRVAIITTGSELVAPGGALTPGAIYNSNQAAIAGSVLQSGAEVAYCLHVADDESLMERALATCADADLLLTTGGVSVGEHDLLKVLLQRIGDIKFWRVLIKPGKPVAFGTVFGRPLVGLPGNPVSALVTYELLVAPALRKLAGRQDCLPLTVQATLLSDLRHKPGRREYRQASLRWADTGLVAQPSEKRGAAMLTSAVATNALVVIPEDCDGVRAGERVSVIVLGHGRDEL